MFSKEFLKLADQAKYQMAFSWGKEVRVAPNAINRSSIFGVVRRGRRRFLNKEQLVTIGETKIEYTGFSLDQGDKDVFYELLHRAKASFKNANDDRQPYVEVRFGTRDFLRAINRTESGASQKWLKDSIERLMSARIKIAYKEMSYQGHLLVRQIENMDTKEVVLHLDRQISTLFTGRTITKINWKLRLRLGSKDTAKWLYDYILSHQATRYNPHRIGLQKLYDMSHATPKKLTSADLSQFRHKLREALTNLKEEGVVASYEVSKANLVFVRVK